MEVFQAQVGGKFSALNLLDSDVDTLAGGIKEVLLTTAEEVLGRKRKRIQPWVSNEVLDLCDKRRELKRKRRTSNDTMALYRRVHREVRQKMRAAKETWIEEQCKAMDKGMQSGNSKQAYDTLRTLTKTSQARTPVIEDKEGKLLIDSGDILKRWTEYCSSLYNFDLQPDISILLDNHHPDGEEDLPVLKEEVEAAIQTLKVGKSPGLDNIPAELLKHGCTETTKVLTVVCQKVWEEKRWPKDWTRSLVIPLPQKGNLKQCQNYRTISLISHPSKVMLRIILNRLTSKANEVLSEEQAGFRAGRSTIKQIFNCRVIIEKHLQHQRDLFHNFIDFKKAFDRVWHDGLWHVLRGYNTDERLAGVIQALYEHSSSAILLNDQLGEFFKTTVGVRQGCLLSPVLFNMFLERIIQETLQDHHTSISIGGRSLCNLWFADDIDLMGGSSEEL